MSSNSERTLVTNDNNPGSVGTQTENSSSKNSLEQEIESLGKEIKSLRKQNRLNSGIIGLGVIGFIGYIVANNWLAIAPVLATLGTAIAAAAPVIGIVVGAIIGAAVLVGASYAVWKYRAQIKEGFKYAAEKTVDGAKYTAEKVKDASVYTAEKAREGYHSVKGAVSSVGKAAKKGTGTVLGKMGRSLSNLSESMSSLDEIPDLMGPQKSQGKAVLLAKRELDPDLTNNGRDSGNPSLRSNSLSRSNSLNSVKTDSTVSSEAELLNPAEHKEVKAPSSLWDRVSSPFKSGKKSEKTSEVKYQVLSESDTLPRKIGNSTFYVDTPTPTENTDKTATIGGRPGVARRNSTSNLTRVGTPEVPTRSASLTNLNGQSSFSEDVLSDPKVNQYLGNSNKGTLARSNSFDSARGSSGPSTPTSSLERLEQSFSKDEVGAAMEKNLKEFSLSAKTESTLHNSFSNRNGSDSGFNSPTSSPTHTMFTENGKAKTQADLRKTGHLDKLVGQPSTKVAVDTDVQQQAAQTAVKTN